MPEDQYVIPIGVKFSVENLDSFSAGMKSVQALMDEVLSRANSLNGSIVKFEWSKQLSQDLDAITVKMQNLQRLMDSMSAGRLKEVASFAKGIDVPKSQIKASKISEASLPLDVQVEMFEAYKKAGISEIETLFDTLKKLGTDKSKKLLSTLIEFSPEIAAKSTVWDEMHHYLVRNRRKLGLELDAISKMIENAKSSIASLTGAGLSGTVGEILSGYSIIKSKSKDLEPLIDSSKILKEWGISFSDIGRIIETGGSRYERIARSANLVKDFSDSIGISLSDLAKAFPDLGRRIVLGLSGKDIEKMFREMTNQFSDLSDIQKQIISSYWSYKVPTFDKTSEALNLFGIRLDDVARSSPNLERSMINLSKSMTTIRAFAEQNMMAITDLRDVLGDYSAMLLKGVRAQDLMQQMIAKTADFYSLDSKAQAGLIKFWDSYNVKIEDAIHSSRALIYGTKEYGMAMSELQGKLGSVGTAVMILGRQMLWVGLGNMFLMMSYDKVVQAQGRVEERAFTLLKSQIALERQQENLREILEEYGAGSKEARKAIQDYNLGVKDVELNHKAMIRSIKAEYLSMIQMFSSMVGQIISMGSMISYPLQMLNTTFSGVGATMNSLTSSINNLANSYMRLGLAQESAAISSGAVKSALAGDIAITQEDTAAKLSNAEATKLSSSATIRNATTKMISNAVTSQGVATQMADMSVKKSSIGVIGLLSGAYRKLASAKLYDNIMSATGLILQNALIGILISGATMMFSMAFAEMMTSIQAKALEEETNNLKSSIDNLNYGSGISDLNTTMSVYIENLKSTKINSQVLQKATKSLKNDIDALSASEVPELQISQLGFRAANLPVSNNVVNDIGGIVININGSGNPNEIASQVEQALVKRLQSIKVL